MSEESELELVLKRMSTADLHIVATALTEQEQVIRDLLSDVDVLSQMVADLTVKLHQREGA